MARTDARTGNRRAAAALDRDNAFRRIGLTRRLVIGAAAALTGGIAAFVSAVAPGKTLGATTRYAATRQVAATAVTSSNRMPPLATPSELGLVAGAPPQPAPSQPQVTQPPVQSAPPPVQSAPVQSVPVQAPPVVVSGGS